MAPAVERRGNVGRRLSDGSISPVKSRHSPRGRSPSKKERSPSRRRSPDRVRSPKRANSSHKKSPAEENVPDRGRLALHVRGRSPPRISSSRSPSPRTKRLRRVQAEQESEKGKGGEHARSPKRSNSSHKKSPAKEKVPDKGRSTLHARGRSPPRDSTSRSPSPRTKRLRRAQAELESEKGKGGEHVKSSREERTKAGEGELREKRRSSPPRSPSPHSKRLLRAQSEREAEKSKGREHGRSMSREDQDKERYGERGEARDAVKERRLKNDKSDGGLSRPSRRDRSVSPARHDRSVSPEPNRRSKHSSRSPSRVSRDGRHEEASRSRATDHSRDDDVDSIARMKAAEESLEAKEKDKQKPSFELSGKLAEETNRVRGVTLLFNEPGDARKPDVRWRLYVFKGGDVLNEPLYVHRQSCYLFGRERRVADIPTDHPSCSKQHAVIQYRLVEKEHPDGLLSKQVRPYLMDLGSTNGTFINDNRIEPQRYYELVEKDTIRFGNSSREYVILHENSIG